MVITIIIFVSIVICVDASLKLKGRQKRAFTPADDLNPPYYTANCPECGNECWTVSMLCYCADTKTKK